MTSCPTATELYNHTGPEASRTDSASQQLAHRSYHQWLPFWLGQGYGQEGYAHHDRSTDWWWYNSEHWQEFFAELREDGFNAYVLWNAHPFPALIDFDQFPEANLFDVSRRERNIHAFHQIVRIAKECAIQIIIQQYNIQVAPGFARAHGVPFIPHNGFGGVDTPIIRDYTAYCISRLFETYPDLGGLMTTFELNKDAIGFLNDGIIAPLSDHPRAKLHFRLWGQHFVEEIARLEEALPGRVCLWHKATEELICLPQADMRLKWWRDQLPHLPLYALTGPCNASGFNFLGRQFLDPRYVSDLARSLKDAHVDGLGWMAGEDNQWVQHAELDEHDQSEAMRRWRLSAWMMRYAAGKAALTPGGDVQRRLSSWVARKLALSASQADQLTEGLGIASRADLPFFRRVSPYRGQHLGLNGACGKLSLAEAAMPPQSYRMMGPYALPLHNWGRAEKSLATVAREANAIDLPTQLPEYQEALDAAAEADQLLDGIDSADETVEVLRQYGRINTSTARYHACLMRAALNLHRVLVEPEAHAAIDLLKNALASVDEALSSARCVGRLADALPAVRVTQRPDLESPHRVGVDWIEPLRRERSQLVAALNLTRDHAGAYANLHRFRRSWDDYLQVFELLPRHAVHVPQSHLDQAVELLDRALERTQHTRDTGPAGALWHRRLAEDRDALLTPSLAGKSHEHTLLLSWRSLTFHSPLSLPHVLATDPAGHAEIPSRRAVTPPVVALRLEDEAVHLIIVRRGDVSNELRVLTAADEQHLKRLRMNLDTGEVQGETAALVPPHALRFAASFTPDATIRDAGEGKVRVTLQMRDLCLGPQHVLPRRFNVGYGADGPYWRCVPDRYGDGLLALDPIWMGPWPFSVDG